MDADQHLASLQKLWRQEVEAATTYRLLGAREPDPSRRDILRRLTESEERHAARWSARIEAVTGRAPDPASIHQTLNWLQKLGDQSVVLHRLEEEENIAEEEYLRLTAAFVDPADRQVAEEVGREEREHARTLGVLAGPPPSPRKVLDTILGRERWHVRGTGWIGDAIYGVNDGLGAVFGIVSGMAGYTGGSSVVLAAGLAGTLASALSMGAGAYLASKSQREVHESEVDRERRELEDDPEEERTELELFYQLKGFSPAEAQAMVARLRTDSKEFLKALVQEELGLSEETAPNPLRSTISATLSTAVGGIIPVIPFLFTHGMRAVVASFIISTLAHFAVGASKALVTTRSWWASGAEMTAVGILEAGITYGIGVLFAGHGG
jgi:VIT1/CCC1 family predicted Fe2+/Mn2+ transporter/rubrerythrin